MQQAGRALYSLRQCRPLDRVIRRSFQNVRVSGVGGQSAQSLKEKLTTGTEDSNSRVPPIGANGPSFVTIAMSIFFFVYIFKLKGQMANLIRDSELRTLRLEELEVLLAAERNENNYMRQLLLENQIEREDGSTGLKE